MHHAIPQMGIILWDFTIDQGNEPVVIEGNVSGGGAWISQLCHGKGLFGERTQEIIEWISDVENLPMDKRNSRYYGE